MQIVGIVVSVFLVDSVGRRPLLVYGSAGCTVALVGLTGALWASMPSMALTFMCLFVLSFSVSHAGVFWVLVSEVFSMAIKSPAAALATGMLFLSGQGASPSVCELYHEVQSYRMHPNEGVGSGGDGVWCGWGWGVQEFGQGKFCLCCISAQAPDDPHQTVLPAANAGLPSFHSPSPSTYPRQCLYLTLPYPLTGALADLVFEQLLKADSGFLLVFAAISFWGMCYCYLYLPETKERPLAEIQAMLAVGQPVVARPRRASAGPGDGAGGGGREDVEAGAASQAAGLVGGEEVPVGPAGDGTAGWVLVHRLREKWDEAVYGIRMRWSGYRPYLDGRM